jgi:hypothetical protein
MAEMCRQAAYEWRDCDPDFAADWDKAKDRGADALEDIAVRRAAAGQSDTLLIFLLKGAKPDKYKDRVSSEVSGPQGKPIEVNDQSAPDRLAAILAAATQRRDAGEDLA